MVRAKLTAPSPLLEPAVYAEFQKLYLYLLSFDQYLTALEASLAAVYATRYDYVDATTAYYGYAAVGSSEAAAVWRVQKFTTGAGGDLTITWADGNSNFDNVWADRTLLSYS